MTNRMPCPYRSRPLLLATSRFGATRFRSERFKGNAGSSYPSLSRILKSEKRAHTELWWRLPKMKARCLSPSLRTSARVRLKAGQRSGANGRRIGVLMRQYVNDDCLTALGRLGISQRLRQSMAVCNQAAIGDWPANAGDSGAFRNGVRDHCASFLGCVHVRHDGSFPRKRAAPLPPSHLTAPGVSNGLVPKEWAKHPASRYDVANGRTLCVHCHSTVHGRKIPQKNYVTRHK